jgi:hypothetical protein
MNAPTILGGKASSMLTRRSDHHRYRLNANQARCLPRKTRRAVEVLRWVSGQKPWILAARWPNLTFDHAL